MYPEDGSGGAGAAGGDYFPEPDLRSRIAYNLEGLIPLILIIIIAFFLAIKFDIISTNTPVVGPVADLLGGSSQPTSMLIIGQSSQEVIDVLNQNKEIIRLRMKSPDELERNPREQLKNYKIVMLDQSEETDKTVSRELGEAIEAYVRGGGNFILVKDSGIRRKGIGGSIAYDVVGWKATFGDIVPVECEREGAGQLSCENKIFLRGKIYRMDEKSPIMTGIDAAPADPNAFYRLEVFNVTPTGTEVAYIKDAQGMDTYPGIVKKDMVVGKSVYFNYNPGKTQGILENTIEWMK